MAQKTVALVLEALEISGHVILENLWTDNANTDFSRTVGLPERPFEWIKSYIPNHERLVLGKAIYFSRHADEGQELVVKIVSEIILVIHLSCAGE